MILCPSWVTAGTHLLFILLKAVPVYCTLSGNIVDLIIEIFIFKELDCCGGRRFPIPQLL